MESLQLGDIGTPIILTIYRKDGTIEDHLDSVDNMDIVLKRPSGVVTFHNASYVTDGTDGMIQYFTIADDIDELGTWHVQAYLEWIGVWEGYSTVKSFNVLTNL